MKRFSLGIKGVERGTFFKNRYDPMQNSKAIRRKKLEGVEEFGTKFNNEREE